MSTHTDPFSAHALRLLRGASWHPTERDPSAVAERLKAVGYAPDGGVLEAQRLFGGLDYVIPGSATGWHFDIFPISTISYDDVQLLEIPGHTTAQFRFGLDSNGSVWAFDQDAACLSASSPRILIESDAIKHHARSCWPNAVFVPLGQSDAPPDLLQSTLQRFDRSFALVAHASDHVVRWFGSENAYLHQTPFYDNSGPAFFLYTSDIATARAIARRLAEANVIDASTRLGYYSHQDDTRLL